VAFDVGKLQKFPRRKNPRTRSAEEIADSGA